MTRGWSFISHKRAIQLLDEGWSTDISAVAILRKALGGGFDTVDRNISTFPLRQVPQPTINVYNTNLWNYN